LAFSTGSYRKRGSYELVDWLDTVWLWVDIMALLTVAMIMTVF
jgi:hypothetical protein